MTLDQYLKRHGHLGNRVHNALMSHLSDKKWTTVPTMTEANETASNILVAVYFDTGRCFVRGLGHKGLLLLAKYFKIKVPKKNDNLSSLKRQLAKAKKRIAELENGEFICRSCGLRKDSHNIPADF